MVSIYNAIKYENVYPVIMCGDVQAMQVINKAIQSVATFFQVYQK